jgi:hypothetical protein
MNGMPTGPREIAPLALSLVATALGVAGALYPRDAAVARAADERATLLGRLEALARETPGDTLAYRFCGDPTAFEEHYYLAQFAFAPTVLDTSRAGIERAAALVDSPARCSEATLGADRSPLPVIQRESR